MDGDPIRRALLVALGPRPTAARRRELAALLRQLADEQEQIAEADTRSGHVVRRAQIAQEASRQKTGRPKGSGARFIRVIARYGGKPGAQICVGRALWQDLGEPSRLRIYARTSDDHVVLEPCEPKVGYAVTRPKNGMPHFTVGQQVVERLCLKTIRYDASVEAGAIVFEV